MTKKLDSSNLVHDFSHFVASRCETAGRIWDSPAYLKAGEKSQALFQMIKGELEKALGEEAGWKLLSAYDAAHGESLSIEAWNMYSLGFRDGMELAGLFAQVPHAPVLVVEDYAENGEADEEEEDAETESSPHVAAFRVASPGEV